MDWVWRFGTRSFKDVHILCMLGVPAFGLAGRGLKDELDEGMSSEGSGQGPKCLHGYSVIDTKTCIQGSYSSGNRLHNIHNFDIAKVYLPCGLNIAGLRRTNLIVSLRQSHNECVVSLFIGISLQAHFD